MEIGRFRCAIQTVFGVRRQSEGRWSHAATALCLRCRTKALDEVSCVIIRPKAASRTGPPSLACRRSPKEASDPGIRFVGGTYRLDTKRLFDVATLGARASRPPRSGQRPLRWPLATIADGTSALQRRPISRAPACGALILRRKPWNNWAARSWARRSKLRLRTTALQTPPVTDPLRSSSVQR